MTHAHDFTLDAELDATTTWDDQDGDFESGYADDTDAPAVPKADRSRPGYSTGDLDLVERHELTFYGLCADCARQAGSHPARTKALAESRRR